MIELDLDSSAIDELAELMEERGLAIDALKPTADLLRKLANLCDRTHDMYVTGLEYL